MKEVPSLVLVEGIDPELTSVGREGFCVDQIVEVLEAVWGVGSDSVQCWGEINSLLQSRYFLGLFVSIVPANEKANVVNGD